MAKQSIFNIYTLSFNCL